MRRALNRVGREARRPVLSDELRTWVAESALRSVPREQLLATVVQNGVPPMLGEREIDAILRSPILAGARRAENRAKRFELRARLERETAKVAREPRSIERRGHLSRDEFFERYYATGTPLIVTDTFETWPALSRWSPAEFERRIGTIDVRVTTGRANDPVSHTHFGRESEVMPMADYCDRVLAAGTSNDSYLISNDFPGGRAGLSPLLEDVPDLHPFVDGQRHIGCVLLWFGPRGTVTPLHHDTKNVFLCQVFGRKKVVLFPRFEATLLGAEADTVYRPIDMDRAEDEAFPELADALRKSAVLSPGEALFIPVGCFHQLRALDVSISLGFSNFRQKNDFGWYCPGRVE
jgi:cupin-like protein